MPFCTACGRQNPDDARFCSQCGTRLVTPDAPAEPSRGETTATISIGAGDSRVETSDRQLNPVDAAAVDAMRHVLDTVTMDGVVIIGEGEKDEAPMLFNGERIGNGQPPAADIAVDPIDGTRAFIRGIPTWSILVGLEAEGEPTRVVLDERRHHAHAFIQVDGEQHVGVAEERQGQ